jgi:hypothetical protein
MDPITALGFANLALDAFLLAFRHARAAGATPEELADLRRRAIDRFDAAATAVAAAEPPPLQPE